jgi:hypothetical protein
MGVYHIVVVGTDLRLNHPREKGSRAAHVHITIGDVNQRFFGFRSLFPSAIHIKKNFLQRLANRRKASKKNGNGVWNFLNCIHETAVNNQAGIIFVLNLWQHKCTSRRKN